MVLFKYKIQTPDPVNLIEEYKVELTDDTRQDTMKKHLGGYQEIKK